LRRGRLLARGGGRLAARGAAGGKTADLGGVYR
jgi:hypothetical protein